MLKHLLQDFRVTMQQLNKSLKLQKVTNSIIHQCASPYLHSRNIFYTALIFNMSKVSEIYRDLFPSPLFLYLVY